MNRGRHLYSAGRPSRWASAHILVNYVLCFFGKKKHAAFKWKDTISRFPVSPGSAEALVRWGGKIKHVLIAYFLCNTFAKNCSNRTVYVKIIASERWDFFFTSETCAGMQHVTERQRDRPWENHVLTSNKYNSDMWQSNQRAISSFSILNAFGLWTPHQRYPKDL